MIENENKTPAWKELIMSLLGLSTIPLSLWTLFLCWQFLHWHLLWVLVVLHPIAGFVSWSIFTLTYKYFKFVIPGFPSPHLLSHVYSGWVALFGVVFTAPLFIWKLELNGN